ncbi:hypothetical protein [Kitasatospora sp. NPDC098663]|uniref:hypothetical protein n=1 Tax=Kitasatospora sp. NPDC098663 TaxID=3364096 RepID=UPI003814124D
MSTAQLQALVDRVRENESYWEASFVANVPSYDPTGPDQPADDEHMNDWDEIDDRRAFDSRELLLELTAELEAIISETEGGR